MKKTCRDCKYYDIDEGKCLKLGLFRNWFEEPCTAYFKPRSA